MIFLGRNIPGELDPYHIVTKFHLPLQSRWRQRKKTRMHLCIFLKYSTLGIVIAWFTVVLGVTKPYMFYELIPDIMGIDNLQNTDNIWLYQMYGVFLSPINWIPLVKTNNIPIIRS